MLKGEKHIAISFLLVFLLPIIYQPVHILGHHRHKHDCLVASHHEAESGNPVVQKNDHCFICEYEFTVPNLLDEFKIPFVKAFVRELISAKIKNIFSFEVNLYAPPRAPPFYT